MSHYSIVEILFVVIGLLLVWAIIANMKELFVQVPVVFVKRVIRRSWLGLLLLLVVSLFTSKLEEWVHNEEEAKGAKKPKRKRRADKRLKFDFGRGTRFLYVLNTPESVRYHMADFLGALQEPWKMDDFDLASTDNAVIIRYPSGVSYDDFCMLLMGLANDLGSQQVLGVFRSEQATLYFFPDPEIEDNILGFTNDHVLFSIVVPDDLAAPSLRVNQNLKVRPDEILERFGLKKLSAG